MKQSAGQMLADHYRRIIATREADFMADLAYYRANFDPADELIDLRRKLWAAEYIRINRALEALCNEETP